MNEYPTVEKWIESWEEERFKSNDVPMAEEKSRGWEYLPVIAKHLYGELDEELYSDLEEIEAYREIGRELATLFADDISSTYDKDTKVISYQLQHAIYENLEQEEGRERFREILNKDGDIRSNRNAAVG